MNQQTSSAFSKFSSAWLRLTSTQKFSALLFVVVILSLPVAILSTQQLNDTRSRAFDIDPAKTSSCVPSGCSNTLCVPSGQADQIVTTCEWQEEYACYQQAICEMQSDGTCGWTQTPASESCFAGQTNKTLTDTDIVDDTTPPDTDIVDDTTPTDTDNCPRDETGQLVCPSYTQACEGDGIPMDNGFDDCGCPNPPLCETDIKSTLLPCLQTDLNQDGDVDLQDRQLLLDNLFTTNPTYDLNQDNTVDLYDYSVWAQDFGMKSDCTQPTL